MKGGVSGAPPGCPPSMPLNVTLLAWEGNAGMQMAMVASVRVAGKWFGESSNRVPQCGSYGLANTY